MGDASKSNAKDIELPIGDNDCGKKSKRNKGSAIKGKGKKHIEGREQGQWQ